MSSAPLFTALLCLSLAAHAGESTQMPRVHASGGTPYVSGGIGYEERQAMQASAQEYNLRLAFSEIGSGALLADIKVSIYDSAGNKLLEINSEGPLLFMRLPAGRYRIEAVHAGIRLERSVLLSAKSSRTLALQWPREPDKGQ